MWCPGNQGSIPAARLRNMRTENAVLGLANMVVPGNPDISSSAE